MTQVVKSAPVENKNPFVLSSQYCSCWKQGISNHDIDLFLLEYSGLITQVIPKFSPYLVISVHITATQMPPTFVCKTGSKSHWPGTGIILLV